MMHEAKHYEQLSNLKVKCNLCPHYCVILPDDKGICRGRMNINGKLYAVNYAQAVSICVDPIEKKPLYHFYPASEILSLGNNGCNLSCDFCQNYTISQMEAKTTTINPQDLLQLCLRHKVKSVAFTYSEPVIWFEYIYDCAQLLKNNHINVVLVSNGYINQRPLMELLPLIDAMNIDLKAMSDEFYQNITGGTLSPVLETIKTAYRNTHIEVTNLIIPGENDDIESVDELIAFIASISSDIPLHLSRYYPQNQRTTTPTSPKSLIIARTKALNTLNYVYLGNIFTEDGANTYCPNCKALLIERKSFQTTIKQLAGDLCQNCQTTIYGSF